MTNDIRCSCAPTRPHRCHSTTTSLIGHNRATTTIADFDVGTNRPDMHPRSSNWTPRRGTIAEAPAATQLRKEEVAASRRRDTPDCSPAGVRRPASMSGREGSRRSPGKSQRGGRQKSPTSSPNSLLIFLPQHGKRGVAPSKASHPTRGAARRGALKGRRGTGSGVLLLLLPFFPSSCE